MTLEKRNGSLYYYRSVRDGDTIRKVYIGSGELARTAHEWDLVHRATQERERQEVEREREKLEALAAPVLGLDHAVDVFARAHLISAGCHRLKGEWETCPESGLNCPTRQSARLGELQRPSEEGGGLEDPEEARKELRLVSCAPRRRKLSGRASDIGRRAGAAYVGPERGRRGIRS